LKRAIVRILRIGVIVYLGMCALAYFGQDWLAFPGTAYQGKPDSVIRYGGRAQVVHLSTAGGIPIAAVFITSDTPGSPTILYFYGNGDNVAWSQGEFDHFRAMKCNVLIPDFAGYGQSGGKASEQNFYATADAAWDYLQTRVDPEKIIVVGWSMGAGVAVDLASRKPLAGLVTFNAFTSLPAMGRKMLPWLPTGLLIKYKFDNLDKMRQIHCPVLICNGKLDALVPPGMSDQLAASAAGPVTRLVIPTADHNTIFTADPKLVWAETGRWVKNVVGGFRDRKN
jgi:pimeloyl-ACP methyl ester carboxylesterase